MGSKKSQLSFWALSLAGFTASLVGVPLAHATSLSSSFVLEGRLYNSDRTDTVTSSVDFLIGVYSPDGTCLLYEESAANIDLSQTDGLYRLMVGANTKSAQDPGLSFSRIFSNANSPIRTPGPNCPSGYTPLAGDLRNVRLQVTRHDSGATETLSPDLAISPIPQATVAETVQGLTPLDLLQISGNSTPYTLTKSALDVLLGPGGPAATAVADASSLHHHDSLYAKLTGSTSMTMSSGALLGLGPRASDPAGLTGSDAGKTWYDSTSNQIKYWNGSSVQTVGTGSSGVSSVTSAGSPISIGGTASAPTVGITQATSVADGYLSSADWLSFNNKVSSQWNNGASSSINYTAGNVGIGTTSPGSKLDVVGNALIGTGTGTSLVTVNASSADSARGKFKILGGGFGNPSWDMGTDSANDVFEIGYIYSGSRTSKFAITQAGNVGIGNATPATPLHVKSNTANAFTLERSTNANSNVEYKNTNGSIFAGANSLANFAVGSSSNLDVPFFVVSRTSGNVGIGTTTPAASLDVAGAVKVGATATSCSATNKGSIRYNTTTNVLEFCNGTGWNLVQAAACTNPTPNVFSFSNQANVALSTQTTSDIIQINGMNCSVPVTISGAGSPQYQICSDSGCSTVVQGWTNSPSSITAGQYLQLRQTSDAAGGVTTQATVIIGSGATVWSISSIGDCSSNPAIGTVCADGTVYAGLSPDGSVPMYVTRCDAGQSWNGTACTGIRTTMNWNNGTSTWTSTGYTNSSTGKANSAGLAALSDGGAPYSAAAYCESLTENGKSDWYLPSKNELSVLYNQLAVIQNFNVSGLYWSSSEYNNSSTWYLSFSDGSYPVGMGMFKYSSYLVRCVRR